MDQSDDGVEARSTKFWFYIVGGLVTTAGLLFWVGYQVGSSIEKPVNSEVRLNSTQYRFINPLLDNKDQKINNLLTGEVASVKKEIDNLTLVRIDEGKITSAAIYARDLNNGPWFSAGNDQEFRPASLLKVPIMIAFFKWAETEPEILNKVVAYTTPVDNLPSLEIKGSENVISVGSSYTILELIERMIIYSDNAATQLLYDNIEQKLIRQVYTDLNIEEVGVTKIYFNNSIGPREYASFLRILYNSTYLSRTYSEKALEIMSRTTYQDSIRSVLAPGTMASTKYGVTYDSEYEKGLHECGIIYWTKNPYVLCVMTSGSDYGAMAKYIAEVTAILQAAVITKR